MVVNSITGSVLEELNFNPNFATNLAAQTWLRPITFLFINKMVEFGDRAMKKLKLLSSNYVTSIVSFS